MQVDMGPWILPMDGDKYMPSIVVSDDWLPLKIKAVHTVMIGCIEMAFIDYGSCGNGDAFHF